MSGEERFEQQSFFDDEDRDSKKEEKDFPKGPPLFRDGLDDVDEKEGEVRYFKKGTCIKMSRNERKLFFLQSDIIARHIADGKRDKEGFERFRFFTNAEFKGKKSDYVRADRGKFSICFNFGPKCNILWIRSKDGSIRQAKEYLKENRIGLDEI